MKRHNCQVVFEFIARHVLVSLYLKYCQEAAELMFLYCFVFLSAHSHVDMHCTFSLSFEPPIVFKKLFILPLCMYVFID